MALESPAQPPPRLAAQHLNEQTNVFFLNTTQRQVKTLKYIWRTADMESFQSMWRVLCILKLG